MLITLLFVGSSLQISAMISRSEYDEEVESQVKKPFKKMDAKEFFKMQQERVKKARNEVQEVIRSVKHDIAFERSEMLSDEVQARLMDLDLREDYVPTDEELQLDSNDYRRIIKALKDKIIEWRDMIRGFISDSDYKANTNLQERVSELAEAARYGDKKIEELEKKFSPKVKAKRKRKKFPKRK